MTDLLDERCVQVLLPMSAGALYDYRVPPQMDLHLGQFVEVPLGPRQVVGVVWKENVTPSVAQDRLKSVLDILPCPALPSASLRFVDWVANYTVQRPGRVLRMCMSIPDALYPKAPKKGFRHTGKMPEKLTAARRRVLAVLDGGLARTATEISELAGTSSSVLKGLESQQVLESVALPADASIPEPDPNAGGFDLSELQQEAAATLCTPVSQQIFSVSLLDGVTGSGKTEVYFEAIAECLSQGRQALVLLPEIALSSQWLSRFEQRFGVKPVEWHSDLGQGTRRKNWRAVIEGKAKVVVGARSALFLPFNNLGLVVVDEEHEASFKQDEGVPYNARDMAVVRGSLGKFPVILASATPSLETLVNAHSGKYTHVKLPSRFGGAVLPDVEIVDLKLHRPGSQRWISEPLQKAVEDVLALKQQAMLFLNRRGYAPLTLCDACGHRLQCPHCSAWLVEHRLLRKLQCHHCGFSTGTPKACPDCEETDSFKACGPGIERLTEEAGLLFPDAKIAMIASDTLTSPSAAAEFVRAMTSGEIDILIGTQIVAKGYHFPNLTLVGVVDADLGLAGGDLRASERTFQLLSQVAGRAGRAEQRGKVLLQSHMPEHPVIEALAKQDTAAFMESERLAREEALMPPYGRLASLILSSTDAESVLSCCKELSRGAPYGDNFMIMGPAPAPLSMIRGRHRYRFLLKTAKDVNLQSVIRAWLKGKKIPSNTRLQVDVDPYNFL
ncbi:primosomal protein N' [Sneathiella aquimaris]|uniref:primosomal protein N' n=1 Tax=Sneathiella aquimaris TaxID=2599305 RepID=UPI00146B976D|nr:primosomal protein N' [Sneathiella aquimaris]